jgi:D-alanyl-D-alanine carboxypeptidase/D-alanyl-D-alanine-endopeptidase (penicillin-binding protein 4)
MDLLGKDYRFTTEFFVNDNLDLLIKGHGDPFLISDEIRVIADSLKAHGIASVNKIMLDHSYFISDLTIPGVSKTNDPYNALNGATVVNFNTINVKKTNSGIIISGELETPLTPLAQKKAATFRAGSKQRINLSDNRDDCHRYAGELFTVIFKEKGISVSDTNIGETESDETWKLVYTHKNIRDITEVIKGLLKYSNNYIANQIFLEIGAQKIGAPASLAKGKIVFEKYIRDNLNLSSKELRMIEGSGISRSNSVTGDVMVGIMEKFKPNAKLLPIKKGQLVKSGTLTGVYNYAGYIKTSNGLRAFSIMLNQKQNFRDSILKLLAEY